MMRTKKGEDKQQRNGSRREVKVTSILGPDCTVKGEIHCSGTVRIDGAVEGTVKAENTIVVGQNGKIDASLHAKQVIIGGVVKGNVYAADRVEIQATGSLHGDVCAPKLAIAEGVVFQGRSNMDDARNKPSATPVKQGEKSPAEKSVPHPESA